MSVTITALELENVKRIRAVSLTPAPTGLTVIGGNNNQGKTSVLDAIAWALGGNKYRPSNPRQSEAIDPHLRVTLSNGITVERKGKNSTLKITDPTGQTGGQALLDKFLSGLALNLPRFMESTDRDKAQTLLQIIGVGDKLVALDDQEAQLYNQRRYVGQEASKAAAYAEGLPAAKDAPEAPVSATELIQRQQTILLRNAENQRKRESLRRLEQEQTDLQDQMELLAQRLREVSRDLETARKGAATLVDESTAELERDIQRVDEINQAVRVNQAKAEATQRAKGLQEQYDGLTVQIEDIRDQRRKLLDAADLPLPGLTVRDGALEYKGQRWDCMSGSDQLRVGVAIVRKLNPNCGFVLLDKLEQMDKATLAEFAAWLEQEGLQAIATRVSTGDECSIIIEDGLVKPVEQPKPRVQWAPGYF